MPRVVPRRGTGAAVTVMESARDGRRTAVFAAVREILLVAGLFLAYELELPEQPGPVQEELNIAPSASYVISVKNPKAPDQPNIGLREEDEASFPKSLQKEFRGRRFGGENPHLLDFEGAEFILIGAREDPEKEVGVDLGNDDGTPDAAQVLRRLVEAALQQAVGLLLPPFQTAALTVETDAQAIFLANAHLAGQ